MEKQLHHYLQSHHQAHLEQLFTWLRIPSISADPAYHAHCAAAADFLVGHLKRIGFATVHKLPTTAHDVVYAEWLGAPDKPTILLYGHYDVQPPDPLEQWQSPPFEPEIRQGFIHGRGTCDDKGQVMMMLNALEAWHAVTGSFPVNIRCYFEGDEESGLAGVHAVAKYKELLTSDAVLVCDTAWVDDNRPSLFYGMRGIAFVELAVRGAKQDLHSGLYGGLVYNPINVLTEVLAKLRAPDGAVAIPGFYDDVAPISAQELAAMREVDYDAASLRERLGVAALFPTRQGLPHKAMQCAQPTMDLCGIIGGYTGEGAKTVIASTARAKVSFRLVPNQDCQKIFDAFEAFVATHMPAGVTWTLSGHHGAGAYLTPFENPYLQAAARVMTETFGAKCVLARDGGAIPILMAFQEAIGAPAVLCGMGLPEDAIHSPFEKFSVTQYQRGSEFIARLLAAFAERPRN